MFIILKKNYENYDWKAAIENTNIIAESCSVKLPVVERTKFPYDGDKLKLIRSIINNGLKQRKLNKTKEVDERINYELKLIEAKGFVDYFLIIHDLVSWAKNNDILVGQARGS